MLKLLAIILPDKVFISHESDNSYNRIFLHTKYLFDGEKPLPTNKEYWYELPSLPKKVQSIQCASKKTVGFKLKDGFVSTDKLPEMVSADFFHAEYDEDEDEYIGKNADIFNLYDPILEEIPESYIDEEFEITKLANKNSDWKFVPAPKNVQHYLLDEILTHKDLRQDTRCFLPSEESYRRIREFVKLNINPKAARVSSDYDFHFEVSKVIQLHQKEKYKKNVKPFSKRPKYVDDYRTHREISVYDIIPREEQRKSYSEHSHVAPKFEGANYEELEQNVQDYLEELIAKINKPLKDCACCGGSGVEEDK